MTTNDPTEAGNATLGLTAEEVLTTTRAVRRRLDFSRPVDRETLVECVRIASQAPSGRNRQRWDFVFVGEPTQKEAVAHWWRAGLSVPQSSGRTDRDSGGSDNWQRISASLEDLTSRIEHAPWLLIPCLRVGSRDELTDVRGQAGGWGSVLPAFWSFMLAARERGLGTAWTTSHLSYEKQVADALGIPYDTVVQAALTPIAYTLGTDFRPARRASPEDFVHWHAW